MNKTKQVGEQVDAIFKAVCEVALVTGAAPLNKHPNCWEYEVDDQWRFAWNGHPEPKPVRFADGMSGMGEPYMVRPVALYVEYNGWMAGEMDPVNGGWFAAGEGANPDTFIAALQEALTKEAANVH